MNDCRVKPVDTETEDTGRITTTRVDVFEKDDEFVVTADMPGVEAKDVDIRFENGELTLNARRSAGRTGQPRAIWENDVRGYHRSFRLGDQVASDKIDADLSHGVLTLRLPKVEALKPRRIAVKGM